MKTPVTFEKADILKLVYAFMKRKGFDIPDPSKVTYKGALAVTINIEYELTTEEVEEAAAPAKVEVKSVAAPEAEETTDEDMEAILRKARSGAGSFPPPPFAEPEGRTLGSGESYEWPGE